MASPTSEEITKLYNTLPDKVDFNFDVKPILSDKCFACHGPDQKSLKADLRLDIPGDALQRKESGDVPIIPGTSARSPLIKRSANRDLPGTRHKTDENFSFQSFQFGDLRL